VAASKALWKGAYREKTDEHGTVLERTPVEHLDGVAARDLSPDDLAALTDEQRAAVQASDLYEVVAADENGDAPASTAPAQPPAGAPGAPGSVPRRPRGSDVAAAAEAASTVRDAETITVVSPTTARTDGGTD
jgi:hypothetical protein